MKLKYDELLSNFACFAFNFNLRHYTKVCKASKVSTVVRAGSGFTLETSNMIENGRAIKLMTEKECAVGRGGERALR